MSQETDAQLHVGDVGTVIVFTIKDENGAVVNLATATGLVISLQPEGGASKEKNATLTTDGTDGKMQYALVDGDLDVGGIWFIQARVTFSTNAPLHTQRERKRVFTNNAAPA